MAAQGGGLENARFVLDLSNSGSESVDSTTVLTIAPAPAASGPTAAQVDPSMG
jgi:hypothetical protein